MYWYASAPAQELVVRRFVSILESAPSAHVVNQNYTESILPCQYFVKQTAKTRTVPYSQAAPARIRVSSYHLKAALTRVTFDCSLLNGDRICLFVRGHSDIFSCRYKCSHRIPHQSGNSLRSDPTAKCHPKTSPR